ncbi:MAG: hypothetical protein WD512_13725 [Candidatus Paceibacterota bacterium]
MSYFLKTLNTVVGHGHSMSPPNPRTGFESFGSYNSYGRAHVAPHIGQVNNASLKPSIGMHSYQGSLGGINNINQHQHIIGQVYEPKILGTQINPVAWPNDPIPGTLNIDTQLRDKIDLAERKSIRQMPNSDHNIRTNTDDLGFGSLKWKTFRFFANTKFSIATVLCVDHFEIISVDRLEYELDIDEETLYAILMSLINYQLISVDKASSEVYLSKLGSKYAEKFKESNSLQ